MRVWITRSEPGASRQAAALTDAGVDVLLAPLIRIEATGAPVPEPGFQHVIFLSEQAVLHGGGLGYCRDARIHALGPATARALAAAGVPAGIPATASSEGLLDHLKGTAMEGSRVLIVAGEAGRKTLGETLSSRGAIVREYLCYRRRALHPSVNPHAIDAVLVASQDGFRALARVWFPSGGRPDIRVIVASSRIAELAPELGFANCQVARGASVSDWLAALR